MDKAKAANAPRRWGNAVSADQDSRPLTKSRGRASTHPPNIRLDWHQLDELHGNLDHEKFDTALNQGIDLREIQQEPGEKSRIIILIALIMSFEKYIPLQYKLV